MTVKKYNIKEDRIISYTSRIYTDTAGFEDGLNLYAFVLNDPLIHTDLYGLYANPWMFSNPNYSDQAWKGFLSGAWNFTTKAITGLVGSNDDSIYWDANKELQRHYQREASRNYINQVSRDWFADKIHADVNNSVFKGFEKWTERGLNAAALYYSAKSAFNLIKPNFNFSKQLFKQFNYPQVDLFSGRNRYSGIDVERIVKDVKNLNKQNNLNSIKRSQATKQIQNWLGKNYKTITNATSDKIFLSKDGLRKIRYDFKNSHGTKPHMHLEIKVNDEWIDATNVHRIYPKDSFKGS